MSNQEQSWFEKLSYFLSREPHSQSQLIDMLRDAEQRQLIDRDALQMIEGVIAVSDKKVRDVMIPRSKMVVLEANAQPKSVLPAVIQSQHSRFPVISEDPDKIIGIILAKDLLPFVMESSSQTQCIRDLMRPVVFIPESKKLDVLLKELRLNRNHMAIVVDEYGNVSGLVTIEDVLEEIVGEIEDEYDVDEKESLITQIDKNLYLVNAFTPITDFNTFFQCQFSGQDVDTIGGLVLQKFGYLPKRNEKIYLQNFEVTVAKANKRGIQLLQIRNTV